MGMVQPMPMRSVAHTRARLSPIPQWSLSFLYDLSVGGQFTVSMRHRPLRRCTPLELADQYIVLCILIGVLAFVYEVSYLSIHQPASRSIHPPLVVTYTCIHTQLLLIKSVLDKYRIFQLLSGGGSSRAPIQAATSLESQSHPHEASPLLGGGGSHQPHQHYHATTPAAGAMGEEDSAADDDGPTGGRPVVAAATVAAANSNLAGGVVGWEALTWWDQIEILNVWTLVAMAGCVCVLLFAGLALRERDDLMVDGALRVLVGLASLLLWLALIQYLEYDPRYYTLVLTIRRAVPRIVQFVGGIVPMFIGYCLLGTILFGDRTEYFGSLSKTAATLFCVVVSEPVIRMHVQIDVCIGCRALHPSHSSIPPFLPQHTTQNGDSIKLALDSISYVPVVGALYIVVYLCLFAYV